MPVSRRQKVRILTTMIFDIYEEDSGEVDDS